MKWFLTALVGLSLLGCAPKTSAPDDVQFAQTAFTSLANGDVAAEKLLDFDSLQMMGMNVGSMYKAMPDETQKSAFRTSFVSSFSKSFKAQGADAAAMKNWRLQSSAPPRSVVAADGKNGPLYITVINNGGTQKIAGLSPQP